MSDRPPRSLPKPLPCLVSRAVADEFVVINERTGKVHKLVGPTAEVWRSAQAGTHPDMADNEVADIVASLIALDLLELPTAMDRRVLLQRAGVVGAVGLVTIALSAPPAFASCPRTFTVAPSSFPKHTGTSNGSATPTLSGTCFKPNATITFTYTSFVLAISPPTTLSDASGSFSQVVTMAYSNGVGTGTITASDGTNSVTVTVAFN